MAGSLSSVAPPPPSADDRYSTDYQGSRDEWTYRVARTMAENYMRGVPEWEQFHGATATIGQPNGSDFGSAADGNTGHISEQTYDFFVRYAEQYADSDPYIAQTYGTPPTRSATFGVNPNSESEIVKAQGQTARDVANINAGTDRYVADTNAATSRYATDTNAAVAREQIASQQQIATMDDATRRYIAEGDWGVQKWVTQLQENGQLERLKLQLADNDKSRALQAQTVALQHHEAMLGIITDLAKYDADLASKPMNIFKYAAWLQNRGIVVNGLNVAMAADLVPQEQVNDPAMVANSGLPGASIGALQTAQEVAAGPQPQGAATQPAPAPGMVAPAQSAASPMAAQATPASAQGQVATPAYDYKGIDLNGTDYAKIAQQVLGMNPAGANGAPSTADLQSAYDQYTGAKPGWGAWGGPTTNNLGVNVKANGQQFDYRQFSDLLPSGQDVAVAGAESVGKFVPDFLEELQRSRPKGGFSSAAAQG